MEKNYTGKIRKRRKNGRKSTALSKRERLKKGLLRATAAALGVSLGVGGILQSQVAVEASFAMMPGIEMIVSKASQEEPFRILEIVDEKKEAEIGYYVSGQEPFLKLYTYEENGVERTFSTVEEALKTLPEKELREELMNNVSYLRDEDGKVTIGEDGKPVQEEPSHYWRPGDSLLNEDPEKAPLSFTPYEERYFLSPEDGEDWTRVDFEARWDEVKGYFEPQPDGKGDYTKGEQTYYPIRRDVPEDQEKKERYRENIWEFSFATDEGASAPYFLEFQAVDNAEVNGALTNSQGTIQEEYQPDQGRYGYFEKVYEPLTDTIVEGIQKKVFSFPGENPACPQEAVNLWKNVSVKAAIEANTDSHSGEGTVDVPSDGTWEEPADFSSGIEEVPGEDPFGDASSEGSFSQETIPEAAEPVWSSAHSFSAEAVAADAFGSGDLGENLVPGEPSLEEAKPSGGDFSAGDELTAGGQEGEAAPDMGQPPEDTLPLEDGLSAGEEEPQDGEPSPEEFQGEAAGEEDAIQEMDVDVLQTTGEMNRGILNNETTAGTQENPYIYLGQRINEFPYYTYECIGDLAYIQDKIGQASQGERQPDDITLEEGQYYIWRAGSDGQLSRQELSIVTGRQPVEKKDVRSVPDSLEQPYYYRVSAVYFCCKKNTEEQEENGYSFDGWYYPVYGGEPYLKIQEGETCVATHYISDPEYTLTPGIGDSRFVQNENEDPVSIEVNHLFYKGGYKNHDWLKRFVFHLDPEQEDTREDFERLSVSVDTMTVNQPQLFELLKAGGAEDPMVSPVSGGEAVFLSSDSFSGGAGLSSETLGDGTEAVDVETEAVPENFSDGEIQGEEPQPVWADGSQESSQGTEAGQIFAAGAHDTDASQTFAAGDHETEVSQVPSLGDYDLIYVNGSLSVSDAEMVRDVGVPLILNYDKVEKSQGLQDAFSSRITGNLTHFVNQNIYFFSDTDNPGSPSHLVNGSFHAPFDGVQEDGTAKPGSQADGFSEILEYIASENEYRQLSQGEMEDGEDFRLPFTLSQARAVEYILNYRYRRTVWKKDQIRVLDIEPSKYSDSAAEFTEDTVHAWMGVKMPRENLTVQACCYENGHEPERVIDGNKTGGKIWHTKWDNNGVTSEEGHPEGKHWLRLTLKEPGAVSGFTYTPRPNNGSAGDNNGIFQKFQVELKGEDGTAIATEIFTKWNDTNERAEDWYYFGQIYDNVKTVEFIVENGVGGYASCREMGLLTSMAEKEEIPSVEVVSMTSSEFVGNIQDLNKEYDMIYLGANGRAPDKNTAVLTNGGDTPDSRMLYSHVGGAMVIAGDRTRAQGILDSDYNAPSNPKQVINWNLEAGSVGSMRGSGNDITGQQVEALLEFAKSGYPLILDDGLYREDGLIDESKVDNSSCVYQLLESLGEMKGLYPNICRLSEFKMETAGFYLNLPKPVLRFREEPVSAVGGNDGSSLRYLDRQELRYVFQIEDEAQSSPAGARYHCELFLDLNSDGNFSVTEGLDDIQISGADGIVLNRNAQGRYELKLGELYTLTRELPEDYSKLITWKLKVSNNDRPQIWTTQQGYTRSNPDAGNKPKIDVLQISPDYSNWDLQNNKAFQHLLKKVDEYEITVKRMTIRTYVDAYVNRYENPRDQNKNLLDDYDMLIIGFADMYANIPNTRPQQDEGVQDQPPGAMDAILNFIQDGKSVLFSHDTTSYFCNRNDSTLWGHNFNYILRPLLGMDRYGVVASDTTNIIKRGKNEGALTKDTPDWDIVWQAQNLFRPDGAYLRSNGDMAYVNGSNRKSTYWETQGFTPHVTTNVRSFVSTARQVNEGAITEYPYQIPKEIVVSSTHDQYYQLALEEDADQDGTNDIIVWYCLTGGAYDNSPSDVRNNYYLYSKGNVMYTGVGHKSIGDVSGDAEDIDRAIDGLPHANEMKLFVNTIVAAYRASAVDPKIKFVNGFSRTAEKITSDYYMTDQYLGTGEMNVVDNRKQISFTVDDYNLVAASSFADHARSMKLQLFIESDSPEAKSGSEYGIDGITEKVVPLDVELYRDEMGSAGIEKLDSGTYKVQSGSVYSFFLEDLERYVRVNGSDPEWGYRKEVRIYAHVSVDFTMYGKKVEGENLAVLTLRQRQLFDLD